MFSEFNSTLKLVDQIYVTDQANTSQKLVSSHLYVDQMVIHEMEGIEFVKNYNNFDVNFSFLENFVKKDLQSITNQNFDVSANNCSNNNDMFLILAKENGENNVYNSSTLHIHSWSRKIAMCAKIQSQFFITHYFRVHF